MFNQDYAKVYDVIYKSKSYSKESKNVVNLTNKYLKKKNKSVFEFGCGTGNHCFYYAKYFKNVYLYDKSKSILKLAKKKLQEYKNVVFLKKSEINKNIKVDVIFLLFDVFSYLINGRDLKKKLFLFNKISSKGGLLIFDFWLKDSLTKSKPRDYEKSYKEESFEFIRKCKTNINYKSSIATINYEILFDNKKFREKHKLKFFSFNEINELLNLCGYKVVKYHFIDDIKKSLNNNKKWSILCVAKKII